MGNGHKSDIMSYQNDVFEKLHCACTLVNMTKCSCLEREFKGQYYGISPKLSKLLSNERNEYLDMLELISDKLSDILKINLCMESELLQENADNSCR